MAGGAEAIGASGNPGAVHTVLQDRSYGLTEIEDIVPWIRFLVSEGWWMTGQMILVNGGYTT